MTFLFVEKNDGLVGQKRELERRLAKVEADRESDAHKLGAKLAQASSELEIARI